MAIEIRLDRVASVDETRLEGMSRDEASGPSTTENVMSETKPRRSRKQTHWTIRNEKMLRARRGYVEDTS